MTPYATLPETAFWRPSVADRSLFDVSGLWTPKSTLSPQDPVATFGSCFAQHIGRHLRERGFSWLDAEPPPRGLSAAGARDFNYGLFSCRTGNIYTAALLKQWTAWACGRAPVPEEYWEKDGRIYDPFRPTIEPDGFETVEEMRRSRQETLKAFRVCVRQARVFVFTLGLTEGWRNADSGAEYPLCPGVAAGAFDPRRHVFANASFASVSDDLAEAFAKMREINPGLRFLLTVSPVPLTATASGRHVIVATTASKSILRAAADALAQDDPGVDYFPAYEIVTSPVFRGALFAPNQRQISDFGVQFVMRHFFAALAPNGVAPSSVAAAAEIACEEELLDAFGRGP